MPICIIFLVDIILCICVLGNYCHLYKLIITYHLILLISWNNGMYLCIQTHGDVLCEGKET